MSQAPGKAPWAPACVVGVGAQPRVAGSGRALEAVLTVYSLTGQNPVGQWPMAAGLAYPRVSSVGWEKRVGSWSLAPSLAFGSPSRVQGVFS